MPVDQDTNTNSNADFLGGLEGMFNSAAVSGIATWGAGKLARGSSNKFVHWIGDKLQGKGLPVFVTSLAIMIWNNKDGIANGIGSFLGPKDASADEVHTDPMFKNGFTYDESALSIGADEVVSETTVSERVVNESTSFDVQQRGYESSDLSFE